MLWTETWKNRYAIFWLDQWLFEEETLQDYIINHVEDRYWICWFINMQLQILEDPGFPASLIRFILLNDVRSAGSLISKISTLTKKGPCHSYMLRLHSKSLRVSRLFNCKLKSDSFWLLNSKRFHGNYINISRLKVSLFFGQILLLPS